MAYNENVEVWLAGEGYICPLPALDSIAYEETVRTTNSYRYHALDAPISSTTVLDSVSIPSINEETINRDGGFPFIVKTYTMYSYNGSTWNRSAVTYEGTTVKVDLESYYQKYLYAGVYAYFLTVDNTCAYNIRYSSSCKIMLDWKYLLENYVQHYTVVRVDVSVPYFSYTSVVGLTGGIIVVCGLDV